MRRCCFFDIYHAFEFKNSGQGGATWIEFEAEKDGWAFEITNSGWGGATWIDFEAEKEGWAILGKAVQVELSLKQKKKAEHLK